METREIIQSECFLAYSRIQNIYFCSSETAYLYRLIDKDFTEIPVFVSIMAIKDVKF